MPMLTPDQWLILGLVFLLGLLIGMVLMAGGKWKRRYREEAARCRELETENARLKKEVGEYASLRHAAAKDEIRRRDETPGPL